MRNAQSKACQTKLAHGNLSFGPPSHLKKRDRTFAVVFDTDCYFDFNVTLSFFGFFYAELQKKKKRTEMTCFS